MTRREAEVPGPETCHASCCVLGEHGILIRGPSGAGKSTAARRLVAEHARRGGFARLVGDDRVVLGVASGRLIARPHPDLAGRLEIRGLGLVGLPWEPACRVRLVLDLLDRAPPRLPEPADTCATLLGIRISRVAATIQDAVDLVLWRMRGCSDTAVTES